MTASSGPAVQLRWERNGAFARDYTLRGDGDVATLRFPKLLSAQAQGSIGGRSYTFTSKGVFRRVVTVLQDPFDQEVATMRLGSRGGTLELIDGRRFTLVGEGAFKQSWSFQDERGAELVSFSVPAFKMRVGEVTTSISVMSGKMLPLLLLAGWYVIVQMLDQAGATC